MSPTRTGRASAAAAPINPSPSGTSEPTPRTVVGAARDRREHAARRVVEQQQHALVAEARCKPAKHGFDDAFGVRLRGDGLHQPSAKLEEPGHPDLRARSFHLRPHGVEHRAARERLDVGHVEAKLRAVARVDQEQRRMRVLPNVRRGLREELVGEADVLVVDRDHLRQIRNVRRAVCSHRGDDSVAWDSNCGAKRILDSGPSRKTLKIKPRYGIGSKGSQFGGSC